MKERYLSKTPFLTFVYISKCNINLPGYFGNSKKRFLWTGLVIIKVTRIVIGDNLWLTFVPPGPAGPAGEEKRWLGGKVWSGLQVSSHFLPLSPSLNLKICLQVIWTNMNPFFGKKAANGVQLFHLIAFVLTKSSISSGNFPPKFPTRLHPSIVCLSSRSNLELQRTEREVLMPSLNKEIFLGRTEAKGV